MKPERKSKMLLGVTRSKAKMYEFSVPDIHHISIKRDPNELFSLTIGILGDLAAIINNDLDKADDIAEYQKNLQFSAHFFDTLIESRLQRGMEEYLLILGSASYFLCDLKGSSKVLINKIDENKLDLNCNNLDYLMYRILIGDFSSHLKSDSNRYATYIQNIVVYLADFDRKGEFQEELLLTVKNLRNIVYNNAFPREILFADVLGALVKKHLEDSVWNSIPKFTGLSKEDWASIFSKETFFKELWPAQRLLGENDVFKGASAVVQMPTSASKTKSTEIIVRSAFLSNRTTLAVIVAPFKALCNEISKDMNEAFSGENINVDQLSDVLSTDYDLTEFFSEKQILVVTPEKLLYILRRSPVLAEKTGLIIYDEGHQFDNGKRGITYELLLASLKNILTDKVQTILISAVISNAEDIGEWLNGETGQIISGTYLTPTYKTISFASWLDKLGRLEFVEFKNPDNNEFFVPRVLEETKLNLRGKETKERYFPDKKNSNSIASYLGLKLVSNGSVAIFCGTKISATGLCNTIIDAYNRGIQLVTPFNYSDKKEVVKLYNLYKRNLGKDSSASKVAKMGIFMHHSNIPNGIRQAVEYGMQENLVKYVVCTSTLAQGVNLPIRYLILTSPYQGTDKIKVRDFHNLIGRVARSGIHTEGSIIFTDPKIYDNKHNWWQNWRWKAVTGLLKESMSEPCISTLDSLFSPFESDNKKYYIDMDPLEFVTIYVKDKDRFNNLVHEFKQDGFSEKDLAKQISWKLNIIQSIESYLMSFMDESTELGDKEIELLATSTLAHFIGDQDKKTQIDKLFGLLIENIKEKIKDKEKRFIYGKTLFGVDISLDIEQWTNNNLEELKKCTNYDGLLNKLWPLLKKYVNNKTFNKVENSDILLELLMGWSQGLSYKDLFDNISKSNAKLKSDSQERSINLEHVVELCDNAFSFDMTLIISSITDITEFLHPQEVALIENLKTVHKMVKYGLPKKLSIHFYELGFSDRILSQELSESISREGRRIKTKKRLIGEIRKSSEIIIDIIEKYPSYFKSVLFNLAPNL